MNVYAKLVTKSKDAKAVSSSLNADNGGLNGFHVKTTYSGAKTVSEISANSLTTVLSTVDDIIRCQMVSEDLI